MRYPESFLDQLRQAAPVSAIIGARIAVRRHGREYMALCPFHKEKTPSFTINDEKGFYHCFGCGAHGDAIGFVKDFEGLGYKEAIEHLAQELGIALPQPSKAALAEDRRRRSLEEIHMLACQWFQSELQSTAGHAARGYLERRGLDASIISQFALGFAPDDRGALLKALAAHQISEAQLVEAGLYIKAEGREAYSRFRGRIMFPIRNASGHVVAFGGRLLQSAANAPKYLNSPETPLFHKGQQLYNLDLARKARDASPLLVCEGYMDVIALAQAGIARAVAPLGTAITAQQLQQLWQLTDEPILCLDGDEAGERAMGRAAELALPLLRPGKSLRFMRLPDGEDPDSLVRSEGRQAFLSLASQATTLIDYVYQHAMQAEARTPEARAAQEESLYRMVEHIEHSAVQAHYRDAIKERLWHRRKPMRAHTRSTRQAGPSRLPMPKSQLAQSPQRAAILQGFALLMAFPELQQQAEAEWFLSELATDDPALASFQAQCFERYQQDFPLEDALLAQAGRYADTLTQMIARLKQQGMAAQPLRLWQHMLARYRMACLQSEYEQASREMAHSLNEAHFSRFAALKEALDSARVQCQRLQEELQLEELG